MIKVDNKYINEAIDNLFHLIGIKEDILYDSMQKPFKKGKIKECIKIIAEYLGLPVEINLSYVSSHYNPNSTGSQGFTTQQLVETDAEKRGVAGIVAQVYIPSYLPLYGTSSFANFPVDVKVSENIKEHPDTFMAIMAHELSHIVLNSLRYDEKDNEIYTDITAMLLGFNEVMRFGRETIKEHQEYSLSSTTTITETTTYGYLSDKQFAFAYKEIIKILKQNKKIKKKLIKKLNFLQKQTSIFENNILKFKNYMRFLDKNINKKINQEDAQKIVLFHQPGYIEEIENFIKLVKKKLQKQQNCKLIKHYYHGWHNDLDKVLTTINIDIRQKWELFEKDFKTLEKNISFFHKLKVNLKIFMKINL